MGDTVLSMRLTHYAVDLAVLRVILLFLDVRGERLREFGKDLKQS